RWPRRCHRSPERLGRSIVGRRPFHPEATAVIGVGSAAGVADLLEPVDPAGDRTGGESSLDCQLAGADSAVVLDNVEAAEVALAHPEALRGEAVECVVLVAASPELSNELLDQIVL